MGDKKSEILNENDNEINVVCYYNNNVDTQMSENDLTINIMETSESFTNHERTAEEFISSVPATSSGNCEEIVKPESTSNNNQSGNVYQCIETKALHDTIDNEHKSNILEEGVKEEEGKELSSCTPASISTVLFVQQEESNGNKNESRNSYQNMETNYLTNVTENKDNFIIYEIKEAVKDEGKRFIETTTAPISEEFAVHQENSNRSKNECSNPDENVQTQFVIHTFGTSDNCIGFDGKEEEEKGQRLLPYMSTSASMELLSNAEDLNRNEPQIKSVNKRVKKKGNKPNRPKADEDEKTDFLTCTTASTSKKLLKSQSMNCNQYKSEGNVNQYIKRKVLKEMLEKGCSTDVFDTIIRNFKASPTEIKQSLNVKVKEAQDFVYQECDSLSFQNITAWLEYFQTANINEHCSYELAIVMNAIAHNELHPQPDDLDGINLKSLYGFLSNALMGLPQPPLDNKSREFLIKEFENLVNEANTNTGDLDTLNMRNELLANRDSLPATTASLNPLKLNNNLGNI